MNYNYTAMSYKKLIFALVTFISTFLLLFTTYKPDLPQNDDSVKHVRFIDDKRSRPHIVFILADDMGWNDIGYHGSGIKTPFLDDLASTGVRLDNYYTQSLCSPSRASIMTGLYQSHTGIDRYFIAEEVGCLPLHLPLIPESLRQNGYATHLIGKWHLGRSRNACLPLNRGFDSFFGFYGGNLDYYTHEYKRNRYNEYFTGPAHDFWDNGRPAKKLSGIYSTHLYANRAEEIIALHGNKTEKKPMFMFLSMQAPHPPLQVPHQYLAQYNYMWKGGRNEGRRTYAGLVSSLDGAVKNVTMVLEKYGMRNNTVIIFLSDNGGDPDFGGSNLPLQGRKTTYNEGGIKVIGFVNSPLLSPMVRNTIYGGLMGAADWYRTLVEGIAGGKLKDVQTDGFNMWDAIRFGHPSPRLEYLHAVGGNCDWNPPLLVTEKLDNLSMYGTIRRGPWKLIVGDIRQKAVLENEYYDYLSFLNRYDVSLYNIHEDPYEKSNEVTNYPQTVKDLLERLKQHCKTHVDYLPIVKDINGSPDHTNGLFAPWL